MSRNVFENNDPKPDEEDAKVLGDGPHVVLPPLAEGFRYEFTSLPGGRTAVTITGEIEEPEVSEVYAPKRDQFGRRKL